MDKAQIIDKIMDMSKFVANKDAMRQMLVRMDQEMLNRMLVNLELDEKKKASHDPYEHDSIHGKKVNE